MASTNFDMDSDESYHSESEFYYPDEMENDKENIGLQHEENQGNAPEKFIQWRVCKSIF